MLSFLLALSDQDIHDQLVYIYTHFHEDMVRYAKGKLENVCGAYDAEDAVQNTYLNMQKYMHCIDFWEDTSRLRQYLLASVQHEVIRLQKHAVYCEDIAEYINTLVADDDFVGKINENEDYRALVDVLRQMDNKYGHLMYLRWVDDLTVKEIAKKMGMQTKTVYKILERGKLLLMKRLEEKEHVKG